MQIHSSFKYGFYLAFKPDSEMYAPSLFVLCTHSRHEVEKAIKQTLGSIEEEDMKVQQLLDREHALLSLPDTVYIYESDDVLFLAETYMGTVEAVIPTMNYQIIPVTSEHQIYMEN